MGFEISHKNIFIDLPLQEYENYIFSCFEGIEKLLRENFYFFFLKEPKSESFFKKIEDIREDYKFTYDESLTEFKKLTQKIKESFTSFSWGFEELELIFIILDDDELGFLDYPQALIGLLIHELLHSIERQRGLEDDLKRSLALSMDTFEEFAGFLSQTKFDKESLVAMFKQIGEIAIYVLKDLYVDREAIERGFGTEVLEQYKTTFNLVDNLDGAKLPEINLNLNQLNPEDIDLENFTQAFSVLLSLVPTWLPFIRISKGFEREQALKLREFIDLTYNQVSVLSKRFHHLENLYLTEFAFTQRFHTKWLSEIYSIVIDYLSGGEFIIWQFSKFVMDLEDYISNAESLDGTTDTFSLQDLILVPVLKSAFIFSKNHKVTKSVNNEILEKLKSYITSEEMEEWETYYEEYTIENLLIFVLSELIRLLREKFLASIQNLRIYTGFILNTLQILIDINEDIQFLNKYHVIKNLIHQFIVERDSRFLSLKILYPLEFEIEQIMFEDEPPFTPDQAEEFLIIARFYDIPKLNWVLEIAKKIAGVVKLAFSKASEKNEPVGLDVIGLTMAALTKDSEDIQNPELLVPIARSVLMALKIHTFLMKEIIKVYGDLLETLK